MTIHATFHRIEHQPWDWRVVITAVHAVYMRRSVGPPSSASIVDRIVWRLGNVLLDSWNSTSAPVEDSGVGYMLHFEMRAIEGHGRRFQSLADATRWDRSLEMEVSREAEATSRVAVIVRADDGDDGYVPPVGRFHRGRPRVQHQPWSPVMVIGPRASDYTLRHEIGHVLGLGEGYRDYLTWARPLILASSESRTIPGASGTPMARSPEAGRDPNDDQGAAILRYALDARAASGIPGQYGPSVNGYRARIAP